MTGSGSAVTDGLRASISWIVSVFVACSVSSRSPLEQRLCRGGVVGVLGVVSTSGAGSGLSAGSGGGDGHGLGDA